MPKSSSCTGALRRDLYVAYKGGGYVGKFDNMTDAKIAVETALGVSTKKDKKKPEPKLVKGKQ